MREYARDKGAFDRGVAWAKEELSKGTPVETLEALCDGAIDYTDFDRGAASVLPADDSKCGF